MAPASPRSKTHKYRPTVPVKAPNSIVAEQSALTSGIAEDVAYPEHVVSPPNYDNKEHLVIVCCHAIFHPDITSASFPLFSPHKESNWHLASFQKSNLVTGKPGEHETFMSHIEVGIDNLQHSDNALLVFSGGATKASLTSLSEAQSYYHAALAHELTQGHAGGGRAHRLLTGGQILLEEHATDSFQNLLFSILLFRRTTGRYPNQIRIITHAFKARRFLELHAPIIRWPADRVLVQGIDPTMTGIDLQETLEGERKYGYAPWLVDGLGTGEALSRKRRQRGWVDSVTKDLGMGLEESVQELLHGSFPSRLPWDIYIAAAKDVISA